MEAVEARWDLASTAPSNVAQGFLFLLHIFSFSYTKHMWAYLLVCTSCKFTSCNPGNLLTLPSALLRITQRWSHLSNLSPVHSSRPLVSSVFCSSEPIQSTKLQAQLFYQFVIMCTHHNPLFCRNPATCVFSLLLWDAPFTDRAVFSIQGQCISHIFTVIARCWHAGILFLSQFANSWSTSNTATDTSVQTSASRLLSVMVAGGGKTTIIKGGPETPTPWLMQCLSGKWAFSFQQWLRTYTTQHKPSLLQDREVRGRGDKQRESDGQLECCERGVCCSFLMHEKCVLFALHLLQRKCVCVPHCLDRQFPLTQNEIFFGQCSGPTLCFC